MADISYSTHGLDLKNGQSIKAAGLIAADTNGTGVTMGRGAFWVKIAWTAAEVASGDELYNIVLEANTVAADTTWKRLGGGLLMGPGAVTGGDNDTPSSGEVVFAVHNPYDYQVRYVCKVNGTIATGANFSIDAYPINQGAY